MDRRDFIGLGGAAAALFGATEAEAAPISAPGFGPGVTAFGVEPNAERDQSAAMQKAIDELTASGLPVFIPAGRYRAANLKLRTKSAVFGVAGLSLLSSQSNAPVFQAQSVQNIGFRGLAFSGTGISALECKGITILDCSVQMSDGDGLYCSGTSLFVANNRLSVCAGSAIWIEGDGMVTGNLVSGGGRFGLRIGGNSRLGTVTVINNMISGTDTGIGVSSAEGGYALISMNMIAGARNGGIRALDGDTLIGKDLTKGGSEAFRNLAIAANVSV
jgi:hypothetical protein